MLYNNVITYVQQSFSSLRYYGLLAFLFLLDITRYLKDKKFPKERTYLLHLYNQNSLFLENLERSAMFCMMCEVVFSIEPFRYKHLLSKRSKKR